MASRSNPVRFIQCSRLRGAETAQCVLAAFLGPSIARSLPFSTTSHASNNAKPVSTASSGRTAVTGPDSVCDSIALEIASVAASRKNANHREIAAEVWAGKIRAAPTSADAVSIYRSYISQPTLPSAASSTQLLHPKPLTAIIETLSRAGNVALTLPLLEKSWSMLVDSSDVTDFKIAHPGKLDALRAAPLVDVVAAPLIALLQGLAQPAPEGTSATAALQRSDAAMRLVSWYFWHAGTAGITKLAPAPSLSQSTATTPTTAQTEGCSPSAVIDAVLRVFTVHGPPHDSLIDGLGVRSEKLFGMLQRSSGSGAGGNAGSQQQLPVKHPYVKWIWTSNKDLTRCIALAQEERSLPATRDRIANGEMYFPLAERAFLWQARQGLWIRSKGHIPDTAKWSTVTARQVNNGAWDRAAVADSERLIKHAVSSLVDAVESLEARQQKDAATTSSESSEAPAHARGSPPTAQQQKQQKQQQQQQDRQQDRQVDLRPRDFTPLVDLPEAHSSNLRLIAGLWREMTGSTLHPDGILQIPRGAVPATSLPSATTLELMFKLACTPADVHHIIEMAAWHGVALIGSTVAVAIERALMLGSVQFAHQVLLKLRATMLGGEANVNATAQAASLSLGYGVLIQHCARNIDRPLSEVDRRELIEPVVLWTECVSSGIPLAPAAVEAMLRRYSHRNLLRSRAKVTALIQLVDAAAAASGAAASSPSLAPLSSSSFSASAPASAVLLDNLQTLSSRYASLVVPGASMSATADIQSSPIHLKPYSVSLLTPSSSAGITIDGVDAEIEAQLPTRSARMLATHASTPAHDAASAIRGAVQESTQAACVDALFRIGDIDAVCARLQQDMATIVALAALSRPEHTVPPSMPPVVAEAYISAFCLAGRLDLAVATARACLVTGTALPESAFLHVVSNVMVREEVPHAFEALKLMASAGVSPSSTSSVTSRALMSMVTVVARSAEPVHDDVAGAIGRQAKEEATGSTAAAPAKRFDADAASTTSSSAEAGTGDEVTLERKGKFVLKPEAGSSGSNLASAAGRVDPSRISVFTSTELNARMVTTLRGGVDGAADAAATSSSSSTMPVAARLGAHPLSEAAQSAKILATAIVHWTVQQIEIMADQQRELKQQLAHRRTDADIIDSNADADEIRSAIDDDESPLDAAREMLLLTFSEWPVSSQLSGLRAQLDALQVPRAHLAAYLTRQARPATIAALAASSRQQGSAFDSSLMIDAQSTATTASAAASAALALHQASASSSASQSKFNLPPSKSTILPTPLLAQAMESVNPSLLTSAARSAWEVVKRRDSDRTRALLDAPSSSASSATTFVQPPRQPYHRRHMEARVVDFAPLPPASSASSSAALDGGPMSSGSLSSSQSPTGSSDVEAGSRHHSKTTTAHLTRLLKNAALKARARVKRRVEEKKGDPTAALANWDALIAKLETVAPHAGKLDPAAPVARWLARTIAQIGMSDAPLPVPTVFTGTTQSALAKQMNRIKLARSEPSGPPQRIEKQERERVVVKAAPDAGAAAKVRAAKPASGAKPANSPARSPLGRIWTAPAGKAPGGKDL